MFRESFADRVRWIVEGRPYVFEEEMTEGTAFLIDGRVAACAGRDGSLLVRTTQAQRHLHDVLDGVVTPLVEDGPASRSWVRVAPEGVEDDAELRRWVAIGLAVAGSMPAPRALVAAGSA